MLGSASHSPGAVNQCKGTGIRECVDGRRFFQRRGDIDIHGRREKVTV